MGCGVAVAAGLDSFHVGGAEMQANSSRRATDSRKFCALGRPGPRRSGLFRPSPRPISPANPRKGQRQEMAIRTATALWQGTLKDGNGTMKYGDVEGPFSFASRFEEGPGTNPEELVGAAHAGCYSMFLSALISKKELTPESVQTTATVTLGKDDVGPKIESIVLKCEAKVPGLSQEDFAALANDAKEKCPISRLYAAGTEIKLEATLL